MVGLETFYDNPRARRIDQVNPVLPVPYGVPGFLLRTAWIGFKEMNGEAGPFLSGWRVLACTLPRFALNAARNPVAVLGLAAGLAEYQLRPRRRPDGSRRGRAVLTYAEGDEYFQLPDDLSTLEDGARSFHVRALPTKNSHEWLLIEPETAAGEVRPGNERWGFRRTPKHLRGHSNPKPKRRPPSFDSMR